MNPESSSDGQDAGSDLKDDTNTVFKGRCVPSRENVGESRIKRGRWGIQSQTGLLLAEPGQLCANMLQFSYRVHQ